MTEAVDDMWIEDDAPAYASARNICRSSARGFYFSSLFLPPAKRSAAYALYAFCRLMDSSVDGPASDRESQQHSIRRLSEFRERVEAVYGDRLVLPDVSLRTPRQHALHAFAQTVREYQVPKQYFLDMAEGCRMNLHIRRYDSWESLRAYCYHAAGVMGLIMCRVLRLEDRSRCPQAIQLGIAMQLTKILRNIHGDFATGRLFLPCDEMRQYDVSERDIASQRVTPGFTELMRMQIRRARSLYREAAGAIASLPNDGSRFTVASMAVLYAGILQAIERQGYNVFQQRPVVSAVDKIRRLWLAHRLSRGKIVDVF